MNKIKIIVLAPNPLGPTPTKSKSVQRPNESQGDWGWHKIMCPTHPTNNF